MCNLNTLQQKIAELTNNGEVVARFLTDTVQGKIPGAQPCHRLEAARQLSRLCNLDDTANIAHHSTLHSLEASPQLPSENKIPQGRNPQGHDEREHTPHTVSYLDILNFNLAQLIRDETADGHTIAEFLTDTLTHRNSEYTPSRLRVKPADRMAAASEILRRGYGHFGRRQKLVDNADEANDYDTLHTDLAKRLRQYSEQGSQAILFLHDVMRNRDPNERFTYRHRLSAAMELLRRGWDTNYDRIKSEHLMDYWQDQRDARLSIGQKKKLAGLQVFADECDRYDSTDYDAIAKAAREAEDSADSASTPHSPKPVPAQAGSGTPQGQGARTSSPSMPDKAQAETQDRPTENSPLTAQNSPDPAQDCYYEPLSPEDQALFDYYTLLESGECKEGEIEVRPATEAARLGYEATLKWMRETAEAEGVPLLPNPLSGALKRPTARSP